MDALDSIHSALTKVSNALVAGAAVYGTYKACQTLYNCTTLRTGSGRTFTEDLFFRLRYMLRENQNQAGSSVDYIFRLNRVPSSMPDTVYAAGAVIRGRLSPSANIARQMILLMQQEFDILLDGGFALSTYMECERCAAFNARPTTRVDQMVTCSHVIGGGLLPVISSPVHLRLQASADEAARPAERAARIEVGACHIIVQATLAVCAAVDPGLIRKRDDEIDTLIAHKAKAFLDKWKGDTIHVGHKASYVPIIKELYWFRRTINDDIVRHIRNHPAMPTYAGVVAPV